MVVCWRSYRQWAFSFFAVCSSQQTNASDDCGRASDDLDWPTIRESMWSSLDPGASSPLSSSQLEKLYAASSTCAPGSSTAAAMLSLQRLGDESASEADTDAELRHIQSGDPRHFKVRFSRMLKSGFPFFGVLARIAEEVEKSSDIDTESDPVRMGFTVGWAPRWSHASSMSPACNSHRVRSLRAEILFYLEDDSSVMPSMPMVEYLESPWASMCGLSRAMALLALATAAASQAHTDTRRADLWLLVDSAEEELQAIAEDTGSGEALLLFGRSWPAWALMHRLQRVLTGRSRFDEPVAAEEEEVAADES